MHKTKVLNDNNRHHNIIMQTCIFMYKRVKVSSQNLGGMVLRPRYIEWEDGRRFHITEITKVTRTFEYEWDKYATVYDIKIGNHKTKLFHDREGWFVDAK